MPKSRAADGAVVAPGDALRGSHAPGPVTAAGRVRHRPDDGDPHGNGARVGDAVAQDRRRDAGVVDFERDQGREGAQRHRDWECVVREVDVDDRVLAVHRRALQAGQTGEPVEAVAGVPVVPAGLLRLEDFASRECRRAARRGWRRSCMDSCGPCPGGSPVPSREARRAPQRDVAGAEPTERERGPVCGVRDTAGPRSHDLLRWTPASACATWTSASSCTMSRVAE